MKEAGYRENVAIVEEQIAWWQRQGVRLDDVNQALNVALGTSFTGARVSWVAIRGRLIRWLMESERAQLLGKGRRAR